MNLNKKFQQMNEDDLTKTQVLNLQDVERAAKFEKSTSKKPAILFAAAGLLSISLGFVYNPVMNYMDKEPVQKTTTTKKTSNIANRVQDTTLTCMFQSPNNADGTNTAITYTMEFDNDKLQSYRKLFTASPITGNQAGPATVQKYITNYKPYDLQSVTGYQVVTTQTKAGMQTLTAIDLKTLNKQLVPDTHKLNNITNPEFDLNVEKNAIVAYLQPSGYKCQ